MLPHLEKRKGKKKSPASFIFAFIKASERCARRGGGFRLSNERNGSRIEEKRKKKKGGRMREHSASTLKKGKRGRVSGLYGRAGPSTTGSRGERKKKKKKGNQYNSSLHKCHAVESDDRKRGSHGPRGQMLS